MDNITSSLREYLLSVKIPNKTLYNHEHGLEHDYPTSTIFHRHINGKPSLRMSIVIDIYPKKSAFYMSAQPFVVMNDDNMSLLRKLENKWNRSGRLTTLVIEEENGVTLPDTYCFKLTAQGFCGDGGLEKRIWDAYIKKLIADTSDAEKQISDISNRD